MNRYILLLLIFFIIVGAIAYSKKTSKPVLAPVSLPTLFSKVLSSPSPSPASASFLPPLTPFIRYTPPKLPHKSAYTIVFLGDSMTTALGPYTDELRTVIKKKYPAFDLIIKNDSIPSTNILSVQDRLLATITFVGKSYPPVLNDPFDIIVVESFGYNPLSEYARQEGLNKQTEQLTNMMEIILRSDPHAYVIFLATIAPSYSTYGQGIVQLSPDARHGWAQERAEYIENHIRYAKDHNIPLVDVYDQTRLPDGDGILKYINPADHIHPSQLGVLLIQDQLAQYFINAKVFE